MLSELKSKLEKLSKAINELPPEWQQLPASDGDDFALQTRAVEPVSQAAVNSSIAERHRLIDSEIDSLAGKIEELRARKARLD
jgi:prefoldin subunit 5